MATRDMSEAEFRRRLEANGFTQEGFMGYWKKGGIAISHLNCGGTRREKLAYILNTYSRLQKNRKQ